MSGSEAPIEITFTLNGTPVSVTTSPKRTALKVLREDFGLTSLKAGCSPQGICGCCAAIINGKVRITCTLGAKTLQGKDVLTLDGMPADELEAYADAFAETGGTQCGYCTPGIVTQTKALHADGQSFRVHHREHTGHAFVLWAH